MARQQNLTDEWLEAERGARAFTVVGGWGSADGVVASPPRDAGWMARSRDGSPGTHAATGPVVLLAPQWPGLEDSVAVALADDAVAVGLLRGGVRVARLRALNFSGPPMLACGLMPLLIHCNQSQVVPAQLDWLEPG